MLSITTTETSRRRRGVQDFFIACIQKVLVSVAVPTWLSSNAGTTIPRMSFLYQRHIYWNFLFALSSSANDTAIVVGT